MRNHRLPVGHPSCFASRRDARMKTLLERAKEAGVAAEKIHEVLTEPEAVAFALGLAKPGDLVVIFADDVTQSWKQVIYWGKPAAEQRPGDLEHA